jgi:putative nucleotidyltransferase with HDIG domain
MNFLKKYSHLIPFLIATLLIVYFLPREGKFPYEYQKGKVWQHKTLNAPFDFPIYKTNAELTGERRQASSATVPYYRRDSAVCSTQVVALRSTFLTLLHTLYSAPTHGKLSPQNHSHLTGKILPAMQERMRFIYGKGIREVNSVAESYLSNTGSMLTILDGNVARSQPNDECFTPKKAYTYISDWLQPMWSEGSAEQEFYQKLDVQAFLKPNLFFNEQLTGLAREQRMANISPTQGVISAGQQIIAHGETVNAHTFRTLSSLQHEYGQRIGFAGSTWLLIVGHLLFTVLFMAAIYLYIISEYKKGYRSFKKNTFIMFLITSFFFLTLWVNKTSIASIYVIPYALVPVFICAFFDTRLALFTHFTIITLSAFIVPNSFDFFLINSFVGLAATYGSKNVYHRYKLYRTAIVIFATYCLLHITLTLIQDGWLTFDWHVYVWFALNASLVIAAYQLVYVFEKLFGFTSDNTLMEISDTNNKFLRKLAEIAPATFQHCMQVSNLAESVIREIGGNPLLVRVGGLYHDIGKINNPIYFVENQNTEFSPHQHLEPEESARIIIKHVTDGLAIAGKYRLPKVIVQFIGTHHGTSLVRYFFRKYKEKHPESTDFSAFQYPGPNPSTKEQGVLMMADSVEAASRTLGSYTVEAIDTLVESVIDSQINGKLLGNTDLTFSDITTAKLIFKKKLRNIYHDRTVAS